MIDRIRKDIQERLEQLFAEADKLRRALVALDPRETATSSKPHTTPVATSPAKPRATTARKQSPSSSPKPKARTAPGATRRAVLAALSSNNGMTAGEVAAATGLATGTVSTTLSKAAKTGEVVKAERGYRLPAAGDATATENVDRS